MQTYGIGVLRGKDQCRLRQHKGTGRKIVPKCEMGDTAVVEVGGQQCPVCGANSQSWMVSMELCRQLPEVSHIPHLCTDTVPEELRAGLGYLGFSLLFHV